MAGKHRRSKRRSDASSSSTPPDEWVFFVDRSLGRHTVAQAVRDAGASVQIHDELFPQDAPDTEWLAHAAREEWLVLTRDKRIRYRPLEIQAVRTAGVRMFVLTAKNPSGPEAADAFVKGLEAMRRLASATPAPFVARVTRNGEVALLKI